MVAAPVPAPMPVAIPTMPSASTGIPGMVSSDEPSFGDFILIVGPAFSGKTTACLTFPKPVFINLDNKLPRGTNCIPFHDPAFTDRFAPRANRTLPPNRKDAVLNWLYQNVGNLPSDITLILDSFSALSDAFHLQAEYVEDIGTSKAGNKALLKVYGAKLNYLEAVFTLLKFAPCRVIVTAHTMPEYDAQGNPTGGVKPFCTGSFSDKIATYATDVFRAYVDIDPNTGKPRIDPETKEVIGYRWMLKPDRTCSLTNTLLTIPDGKTTIRARWQDLEPIIISSSAVPAAAAESKPTTGAS